MHIFVKEVRSVKLYQIFSQSVEIFWNLSDLAPGLGKRSAQFIRFNHSKVRLEQKSLKEIISHLVLGKGGL